MGPGISEVLVLAVVVFVLMAVLRWSVGSQTAGAGRAARKLARARDYGLLREVATAPSERAAGFVQDLLRRNGIRTTTAPSADGAGLRVLVFPADARAAADVLLREVDEG